MHTLPRPWALRRTSAIRKRQEYLADLHERVCRTAAALVGLGVEKGDRVCVWAPNSWQWEVFALAVTYSGGTLTPVNTRYTGHEAVDVVDRADRARGPAWQVLSQPGAAACEREARELVERVNALRTWPDGALDELNLGSRAGGQPI